jgi:hypothetical protein
VSGSGTTYNVAVSGMAQSGTVTVSIPASVAQDAAGNPNLASTSTDSTVTYNAPDITRPIVTVNQAAGQADPTSSTPFSFTVVFSEAVTGFGDSGSDVSLGGTAGATTKLVSGSGTTYNVAVSGMAQSGTVTVSIPAGAAQDAAGNPNLASTSTDNTVTYNPFVPAKGNYAGLFGPTNNAGLLDARQVRAANAGYFTVTLGSGGQFSGKLYLAGTNYSFSGRCDLTGHASVVVRRPRLSSIALDLQFDFQGTPDEPLNYQVVGTATDGSWHSALKGNRTGLYTNVPMGGLLRYTWIIPGPGAEEAATRPAGDGAGTATLTNGLLTLVGKLGDGTAINRATELSQNGDWPIYVPLYGGKGLLLGWGSFSSNHWPYSFIATNLVWFKPPGLKGKFYTNGFTESVQMLGARYARPGPGSHVLNWTNGVLLIDGGNLPVTISNVVQCVSNKWVVRNNTHQIRLTNDLSRGTFGGTFVHPVTRRITPFSGAYLQLIAPNLGWGGGWFAGTNETGFVEIVP